MEIRTRNKIKSIKVGELGMMKCYLIFDKETNDNNLIITSIDKSAIILSKASNEPTLCVLRLNKNQKVNVIGEINDFDIVNVTFNKFLGD